MDPKVKQGDTQDQLEPAPFFKLFRFATPLDYFYVILGTLASLLNGSCMAIFNLLMSNLAQDLDPSQGMDHVVNAVGIDALWMVGVGFINFLASYIAFATFMISGERQANAYKREYFRAILRQDITFFDKINPHEFTTQIATSTFQVQDALGEKISTFLQTIATCLGGLILGYFYCWQLALVLTGAVPFMTIVGAMYSWVLTASDQKSKSAYEEAGGIAEQALHAVRTVYGLNGEHRELSNYQLALQQTVRTMIKYGIGAALFLGISFGAQVGVNALGSWFSGVVLITVRLTH
jgi:ATP-binding cassette subfamily B (MDR/TAP) protein 1